MIAMGSVDTECCIWGIAIAHSTEERRYNKVGHVL
jgi:hypothetical protein